MNAKFKTLLFLLVAVVSYVAVYLYQRLDSTNNVAPSDTKPDVANVDEGEVPGSPPIIDFPLLDQARRIDAIDWVYDFPDSVKKLDGRRVGLVGYMAPFDSLLDMRRCMIVPTYVGCGFCSPPNLNQVVFVTQGSAGANSGPYPFIEQAAYVEGILRLKRSENEEGEEEFLYSIEDATITAHTGEAPERALGHESVSSTNHQPGATRLPPASTEDLVREVAKLLDLEPLKPIEITPVSSERFADLIREELEAKFPVSTRAARTQAFYLLDMIPEETDWIDTLAGTQLAWRVARTNESGDRVHLLESVPRDHAYVRLELIGEIAHALILQRFPHRPKNKPGELNTRDPIEDNEDSRRAHDAIQLGVRVETMYRYARSRALSSDTQPPEEFVRQRKDRAFASYEFDLWQFFPADIGSFFVYSFVGDTEPLSRALPALEESPSTTMECFRPRWFQDPGRWKKDPVPSDFASGILDVPPILTDVLGVSGLISWLAQWNSLDIAKEISGQWAGDRWALWNFPDGAAALLLETRWQDTDAANRFRDAIAFLNPLQTTDSHSVRLLFADSPGALERLKAAAQSAH